MIVDNLFILLLFDKIFKPNKIYINSIYRSQPSILLFFITKYIIELLKIIILANCNNKINHII